MLRIKEIVRGFFCHSERKLRDIRRGLGAANAWHSSIMHSACPSASPFPVTSAACLITRLDAGFLPQRQPCARAHTHTHTHTHTNAHRQEWRQTHAGHTNMRRNIRPAEANRLFLSGEQNICKESHHHCARRNTHHQWWEEKKTWKKKTNKHTWLQLHDTSVLW